MAAELADRIECGSLFIDLRPLVLVSARHFINQVAPQHFGRAPGLLCHTPLVRIDRRDAGPHRAFLAYVTNQCARINLRDSHDAVALQIIIERRRGAPIGDDLRQLAHDEAFDERATRFDVLRVHAVIADLGVGHRHDLPGVRRVGQNLLVAGHRGVEDYLACPFAVGAPRQPAKGPAVFKGQYCLFGHLISEVVEDRGSRIEDRGSNI
jgi:hypothetical protein